MLTKSPLLENTRTEPQGTGPSVTHLPGAVESTTLSPLYIEYHSGEHWLKDKNWASFNGAGFVLVLSRVHGMKKKFTESSQNYIYIHSNKFNLIVQKEKVVLLKKIWH